jgi:hypothetical protein
MLGAGTALDWLEVSRHAVIVYVQTIRYTLAAVFLPVAPS